ncbi:MAG: N-methyl-L-tryptophan oxidase [Actinomycetota bacterium]
MERFDAIVIGGGAMGTAAARELARRGHETLVLERFTVGHANGSSGGPTRIFRYAYHRPDYVRLAMSAREAWQELESAAGEQLLRVTGGIDVGPAALHRADLLEAAGVPVERLRGAEARERWPSLRLRADADVVFQPDGGVLRAAPTVIAQARLAERAGATLRTETTVTEIVTSVDAVEVRTADGEAYGAPVTVVAAGAWAGPLLAQAGIHLTLRPNLEQSTYFRLEGPGTALPTMIDWLEDADHPPYLVPDPWEAGSFKVGLHMAGPATDPDTRTFDADPERVEGVIGYVASHLPAAEATGRTDTCLYTITPDEDFVLDRAGPIVVASPCSGHGFKFVPLFGRALADLATGTEPPFDRSAFRADRAGLVRP